MPKLYIYFDVTVFFYSNEHDPIHVHGESQNRESKAELVIENGLITKIKYSETSGKPPLSRAEMTRFKKVVDAKAEEIAVKWIDYFIYHKKIEPVVIKRKL